MACEIEPGDGITGGVADVAVPTVAPVSSATGVVAGVGGLGQHERSAPWSPPRPLPTCGVPEFPVDALPTFLRSFVEQQAEWTQAPPDLVALMALAAVSASCAKHYQVEDPWTEPTSLWTAVVVPAASRASAVVSACIAPILEIERQQREMTASRNQANAVNRVLLERRSRIALEQAAFGDSVEERAVHGMQASTLAEEIERIRPLALPKLLADDASPESIVSLLGANGGRLSLISSEDGPWTRLVSLATRGDQKIGNILKAFSSEPLCVDRIGRDSLHVDGPSLSFGLRLHPHMLPVIRSHEGLRSCGLLGRFLLAIPDCRVGYRQIEAKRPSAEGGRAYGALLKDLLTRSDAHLRAGKPPIGLTLDQAAHDRFLQVRHDVEAQLRPDGDLAPIADWAGKLCGLVLRLAALLHVAKTSPHVPSEISGETLNAAVRIAIEYAVPHARTVILGESQSEVVERAARVVEWLLMAGLAQVTQRQVHRRFQGLIERSRDVAEVLALLEAHGFVRRMPSPPRPRGGWTTPLYEVHPGVGRVSRPSSPSVTP